jgi:hypothetical protein
MRHGPRIARRQARRLSEALVEFTQTVTSERVALFTIMQLMGRRSIVALLLVLALPMALPIPAPGLSILFGAPLILISVQLLFGRHRAWLPTCVAQRSMSRDDFAALVGRAIPTLHRLERIVRPRWGWMAADWTMAPIGAICLVLSIIITLPLPLGHTLPGTAISILALGLLERDGVAISLGLAIAALAMVVVIVASGGIISWLHGYLR